MISVLRAIEQYGLRRQEQRLARQIKKKRLEALPHVFDASLPMLQGLFAPIRVQLQDKHSPNAYPSMEYLGELDIHAILQTQNIEIDQFPSYLKIVEESRQEVSFHHYAKNGLHTLLSCEDEFSGRTIRLLTNDIELLKTLAAPVFHPPPPWIAWYDLGPYSGALQGNAEHWFRYIWDPFWESLSLEEQDKVLQVWRAKTRAYISDEDWDAGWVYGIRVRDPRFRAREQKRSEK